MATKKKKDQTFKEIKGLTKRQANIIRLRNELNKPDPNAVKPFTKYKNLTYPFVVLFPPYALYRVWNKESTFTKTEQIIQTSVACLFMYIVITEWILK